MESVTIKCILRKLTKSRKSLCMVMPLPKEKIHNKLVKFGKNIRQPLEFRYISVSLVACRKPSWSLLITITEFLVFWFLSLQPFTWSRQSLSRRHFIPSFDSCHWLMYPSSHCVHFLVSLVRKTLLAFTKSSWAQDSLEFSKNKCPFTAANTNHYVVWLF